MLNRSETLAAHWSARLGVQPSDEAWQIAMSMIGVPFLHMGRSERGVDCIGLLMLTAWAQGWEAIDNPHYGREPSRSNASFNLADYLRANLGDAVTRPMQPNDVLLMRFQPHFAPSHLALVAPHSIAGQLGVVHTYGEIGRVAFHRLCEPRLSQIVEVYQWPAKS